MAFENLTDMQAKKYEDMTYEEMKADPAGAKLVDELALEYLKTEDKEWFDGAYTGELDAEGQLIPIPGHELASPIKPEMTLSDKGMQWVLQKAKEKLSA